MSRHAQRLEDLRAHEREERLVRRGFDRRAHQDPAVRRIAGLGLRLEQQRIIRETLQPFGRPLAVRGGHVVLFTVVVPDARHVSHQLAQRDGPLFLGERGHVRLNLVVEMQPAFLQQQADRGRRERLGGVPDPEAHVRRDGHPLLEIRPAKTFGPDDVATDADRHRQSRQVLLDETRTGELSPLFHRAGPLLAMGPQCLTDGTSVGFGCSGVAMARRRTRKAPPPPRTHDHGRADQREPLLCPASRLLFRSHSPPSSSRRPAFIRPLRVSEGRGGSPHRVVSAP